MSRSGHAAILILLAMVIGGGACRLTPARPPVPVAGASGDLAQIAGEWSGRYWSETAQRHGTIFFRLRAGADTAYGEVEMTFAPALKLYGASSADGTDQQRTCTAIDIAIVRVDAERIRGTLVPHWDPDCDCRVSTVFEGTLTADRITGTFTTRRASSGPPLVAGRWEVRRSLPRDRRHR